MKLKCDAADKSTTKIAENQANKKSGFNHFASQMTTGF